MVDIVFISPSGEQTSVSANIGETVMEAAMRAEVEGIEAQCGGAMVCATCHGHLEKETFEKVAPLSDGEQDLIDFSMHPFEFSRLTCQIVVSDALQGAVIRIPDAQG